MTQLPMFIISKEIFTYKYSIYWRFPSGSGVKNPPAMQEPQETEVRTLGRKIPLEKGMVTHSNIPSWRILRTEEPGGLLRGVPESQTQLSDQTKT